MPVRPRLGCWIVNINKYLLCKNLLKILLVGKYYSVCEPKQGAFEPANGSSTRGIGIIIAKAKARAVTSEDLVKDLWDR